MNAPVIVSGFHRIDVINFVDCSECGQSAGTCCISRKGRRLPTPHEVRSQQYDVMHADRRELYTGDQFDPTRLARVREYNRKSSGPPAAGETVMTNEEKLHAIPAPPKGAQFKLASVDNVNHKPHPYTIGARHVGHASDHHMGILDLYAIESAERLGIHCAHPKCRVPFAEHTSDLVCFVEVSGQYESIGDVPLLRDYLQQIADKATELGIDGFAFVKGGK